MLRLLKSLVPDRSVPTRIWRGPFRGARIVMTPRDSLRKIFGLYEHELNKWLEEALRRVQRVVDVGANDGYFTFGCGAALQRLGKSSTIIAIEKHPTNYFVIEVHQERFLVGLQNIFAEHSHRLVRVNQRPLPFLGRDLREENNWWLVSQLASH